MLVAPAHADPPSLAEKVPASIGLFVEARDAADLLPSLTDPTIWSTLADLAGQPAEPDDVRAWEARIRRTIRMEPAEAIRVLLARQAAFVGPTLGRSQDAVLMCRDAGVIPPEALLRRWEARPLRGEAESDIFQLSGGISVANRGGVLVFGDARPADGVFRRVLAVQSDAAMPTLAADPVFQALMRRVEPRPTAILFARLARPGPPPATAPSPDDPAASSMPASAPAARESNILIALHRAATGFRFTMVSDRLAAPRADGDASARLLMPAPPAGLVAAWQGRVDVPRAAHLLEALPRRNVLRVALNLLDQNGSLDRLVESLDGGFCVAAGTLPSASPDLPPAPAVALLASVRDEMAAAREMNALVEAAVTVHDFLSLAKGVPPLPRSRDLLVSEVPCVQLDLSATVAPWDLDGVRELHLCWTVFDGRLIVTSHVDWMKAVLDAEAGGAPEASLDPAGASVPFDNRVIVESERLVSAGEAWLKHLGERYPGVLDESWWRSRQPGGGAVTLGIDVEPDPAERRLRVVGVSAVGASAGLLRPGDAIVGVERKRLVSDALIEEIREAIDRRPHARWVELMVDRDGVVLTVRVPTPFVNLAQALQQIVALLKPTRRVTYFDTSTDPDGPMGVLSVDVRDGATTADSQPTPDDSSAPTNRDAGADRSGS